MRALTVALLGLFVVIGNGCKHNERCWVMSKGYPLFVVDGRDWAFPREVCGLISKSIAESSDGTRTDLFGMGAEEWKTAQPCECE